MVPVTYSQIRTWHFMETLAGWVNGLHKAVVALLAVAGPGLVVIVLLLLLAIADGLTALSTASSTIIQRLAVACTWQAATFAILWALREAVFMPRAAAFFAALPVRASQQLRADLALCMLGYSLLWLAAAWTIGLGFFAGGPLRGLQTLLLVSSLIAFSLAANLLLLRLGLRAALVVTAGLLAFVLPGSTLIQTLAAIAAVALCFRHLWRVYYQPRTLAERRERPNPLLEALALRSGLAALLFVNELRATLLLRLSCVFALLATVPLIWRFKPDDGLETAGFVIVMATATVAFYELPALCRVVAFTKLRFVAGQRNFVRRLTVFSHAIQAALYLSAFLGACCATLAMFDAAPRLSERLLLPSTFFAVVFLGGTAAAYRGFASVRWLMPVVNFVAALLMSGFV